MTSNLPYLWYSLAWWSLTKVPFRSSSRKSGNVPGLLVVTMNGALQILCGTRKAKWMSSTCQESHTKTVQLKMPECHRHNAPSYFFKSHKMAINSKKVLKDHFLAKKKHVQAVFKCPNRKKKCFCLKVLRNTFEWANAFQLSFVMESMDDSNLRFPKGHKNSYTSVGNLILLKRAYIWQILHFSIISFLEGQVNSGNNSKLENVCPVRTQSQKSSGVKVWRISLRHQINTFVKN